MKKFVILLLSFVLVITPIFATPQVALAKETEEVQSVAYDYLVDFVSKEENNVPSYEQRQQNRADYLVDVIKTKVGYEDDAITLQKVNYVNQYLRDANEVATNIIVEKKAKEETDKYIVISANYDNAEGLVPSIQNSDGTSSNGTGVGSLLAIMEKLKDIPTTVNVKFAFFCASEVGLRGSKEFIHKMSTEDMNNMMLLINLAHIGAGDNTYIYDDEVHWKHFDYFYNVGEQYKFNKMPIDKKSVLVEQQDIGLLYSHEALFTDVAPFIAKRMPTLCLFSGNFTANGFVQSERYGSIMQTKDDTLKNFNDMFGNNGKTQMNNAVEFVVKVATDSVLVSVMQDSISNKPDYSIYSTYDNTISIITYVIVALVLVGIVSAYLVIKNKADKSNDPIKPMYINLDIYNQNPNGQNQGGSDPFGVDNNKPSDPFGLDDDDNNRDNSNNNSDNPFGI